MTVAWRGRNNRSAQIALPLSSVLFAGSVRGATSTRGDQARPELNAAALTR